MRSERQVEALKDVGSIPTRPTHGIIGTGTSFISFTGKSYRTGQCNAQNPESACVVSAASTSAFQAERMGSNPITCFCRRHPTMK